MTAWLILTMLLAQLPIPRLDGGTVTGLVRYADGRPAAGVRVAAMVVPETGSEPSALAVISQTDSSGRYRLEAVPPGRYYIVAGRIDAPSFYPAGTNMSAARAITVTAGAAIDGIDVTVSEESTRPGREPFSRIPNLPNSRFNFPPVIVTPPADQQVRGRITMDEGSKGAKIPDRIGLLARYSGPTGQIGGIRFSTPGNTSRQVSVAPDGIFSVSIPEGDATIVITGLPPGYSIKSKTAGGVDLQSQPLQVRAGVPEILIVLTADLRPRFNITGQIPEGAGGQLLGEQVELVTESGTTIRLLIDLNGRFFFGRVLPGKYGVRFASPKFKPAEQPITITDRDVTVELRAEVP